MIRAQRLTGATLLVGILAMLTLAACTETPRDPPPASDALPASAPPVAAENASASVTALMGKLADVPPPGQDRGGFAMVREASKPLAASSLIEGSRTTETLGARPLERVGAETFDPTRVFPPIAAQVPKVWIGWYVNRSIDALRQAIDENKPLVLVVAEGWCKYCSDLAYNALRCAAVDRFAGDAVFAYSFPTSDKGATAIAGSLKIAAYPTITVLEPESRILLERGRINGYFDATRLGGHLDTILWKTAPRVLPDDFDKPVAQQRAPSPAPPSTPRPGAPATMISALFGATSRGLTHAAPAPKCQ